MSSVASFLKNLKSRQTAAANQTDAMPANEDVSDMAEGDSDMSDRDGDATADAEDRNYLLRRRKDRLRLPIEVTTAPLTSHSHAHKTVPGKGNTASLAPGARKRAREPAAQPQSTSHVDTAASTSAVALKFRSGAHRSELRESLLADLKQRQEMSRRRVDAPDTAEQFVFAQEGAIAGLLVDEPEGQEIDVMSLIAHTRRAALEVAASPAGPLPAAHVAVKLSSDETLKSKPPAPAPTVAPPALSAKPSSMTSRLLQLAKLKKERGGAAGENGHQEENLLIQ